MGTRCIGFDVHRDFCEVAVWDAGEVSPAARVSARPTQLREFAEALRPTDRVALEATGNALAIARILGPHVAAVEIVNTRRLKAISESKQKTDRRDAKTLAPASRRRPSGRRTGPASDAASARRPRLPTTPKEHQGLVSNLFLSHSPLRTANPSQSLLK